MAMTLQILLKISHELPLLGNTRITFANVQLTVHKKENEFGYSVTFPKFYLDRDLERNTAPGIDKRAKPMWFVVTSLIKRINRDSMDPGIWELGAREFGSCMMEDHPIASNRDDILDSVIGELYRYFRGNHCSISKKTVVNREKS
jgi:hypothetical protein